MHGPNNYAFIDGTNLHLTYENPHENPGWKLDYEKLRYYLKQKHNVNFAFYFLGDAPGNIELHRKLESYGYTVKLKSSTKYITDEQYCPYCNLSLAPEEDRHKSDCDSFMTLEVISNMHLFDKAVIVTSDGDFDELIKELLRKNKLEVLFAPCQDGCSGWLVSSAMGRIRFLTDHQTELEKI